MLVFGPQISSSHIAAVTTSTAARSDFLKLSNSFLQLHFTLGGAHRGAGDTWTPLVAATLGNWLLRVPVAVIAAAVFDADVVWVWYALVLDHLSRAIWLTWSFRRGRWMTRLD